MTEKSLEDQLDDLLEQREADRLEMEALIRTPPGPLYSKPARTWDTSGVESTAGTFAWNAGAYRN